MTTDHDAAFSDHFSSVASTYARFRPTYPDALFDWILSQSSPSARVWDCAAGSGQATLALAERFASVVATDASAAQVANAPQHPRVEWRVAPAESSGLDAASIDVVTIAQALHWFDLDRFWDEVRRIVKPRGLVAAWTYGDASVDDPAASQLVHDFSEDTVGPWWPPERAHIHARYETLSFPFERVDTPSFELEMHWTATEMLGYMRSWSATSAYVNERHSDPVAMIERELREKWGPGERVVSWPVTMKAMRV